jgi:histone deacetylase complex regulatory component SIN3
VPDRAEVFQRFLTLLANYARAPDLDKVPDVHRQVRELFADEPDLAEGFEQFLPDSAPEKGDERGVGKGSGGDGEDEGVMDEGAKEGH